MGGQEPTTGALTWAQVRGYYTKARLPQQLLVVPDHRLLYLKNPKAGSSTLVTWLDRLHTGETDALIEHMHRDHRLPQVRDLGRRVVLDMLAGDGVRFSFVRDPVRRLESVHRAKMHQARFRRRVAPELGIDPDISQPVPFEQFLEAVEGQDPLTEMDHHWRPQHLNLLHPLVELDFVGRLEDFDRDLARLCELADLPQIPPEIRNAKRPVEGSVYDARPDLRRRVEELYAVDMELYGY